MKVSSRTEYLRRIDRVVERLSESIANEQPLPSITALARHAQLSEFHFMRVYRALAGESLGATIQRLRLERALRLLSCTSAPITEIAGRSGYETPQAFAKAFRRQFKAAPGDVREHPAKYADRPAGRAQPETDAPAPVVRIEIVELQPFRVAALRNHGDYADLDRAYTAVFRWVADRSGPESITAIWGAPHHDRRDTLADDCIFDCCLATAAELVGDTEVRMTPLGGGRYAMCGHVGSYARLDEMHDALLGEALPARGLALRDTPILHHFVNDPECTPEAALETRIYVPIE